MSKRRLVGQVISNKMHKTVVVKVELIKVHPKYHKRYRVFKKFPAHAEENLQVGERVIIEEHRPISKTKRWVVVKNLSPYGRSPEGMIISKP